MPFYTSPEQLMRDRSEFARKGISRGRSAMVLTFAGGVLFVAENFTSLRKVSEIYDRIGFAAVGRYNEFENLRRAGVRMADLNGYSYARRDVTGRALANAYAQTLGSIFTEQTKPFEVEICVAEVGATPDSDELYRITYDGSVGDEPGYMAMGGQTESIANALKAGHRADLTLAEALGLAVRALGTVGGENGALREIPAAQLEVAVLDRTRAGRAFRRISGAALTALLAQQPAADEPEADKPVVDEPVVDGPDAAAPAAEEAPVKARGSAKVVDTEPPAEPKPGPKPKPKPADS